MFIGIVRKDPPLMCAVKLSARRRKGKIIHREYSPTRSRSVGLVVRLMPKIRERTLLMMARTMPLSTTSRKKSIRKKNMAPRSVYSFSATK